MKEPASDLATLVIALVIAALARVDTAVGLVLSYLGAWALVNLARAVGWPRAPIAAPKLVIAIAILAVLLVPLRDLATRSSALAEHEALASPLEHIGDRLALESDPAITPALVSGDRPQTYFVRASGSHVRVRLGAELEWIDAEGLGHGVFRVEYDPRRDGAPPPHAHETLATISVDGALSTRRLLAVTPMPHPRWLRLSPDRARACVPSEETDEVIVISTGRESERIETLDGPTDCAIANDGSLYVTHRFARDVLHVDASRARSTLDAFGFGAVAIAILGDDLCIAREGPGSEIRCLHDGASLAIAGTPLFLVSVFPDVALVVATRSPAALMRIERANGALVVRESISLVSPAAHVSADPSEPTLLVALTDLDGPGHAGLGNHFVEDRVASLDTSRFVLLDDHLTNWRTERQDHAGDVDRGASPLGISRSTRGTSWVAFAGTDEIEEIGGDLARPRVIDTAALGVSAPFSVVELADGSLVVTSPSSGLVVVLDADGELRSSIALASDDHELLRDDPDALQLRFGERAFYEATRSGVSCQSCHLHGGTDGVTHNIGGRIAAPTLDVRGLCGTSPYLRDGSYPRLRDLHEVAVTEYRGYREPAGDRGATIEAWLRTLPTQRSFAARDPEREREGLDVFFRAGCPECHAPPAFTSLGLHAIESVFPAAPARTEGRLLDVPSLRGVGASAPYLYDARAETLRSIFEDHNDPDRHGHTRELDSDALDALVAFLRSL